VLLTLRKFHVGEGPSFIKEFDSGAGEKSLSKLYPAGISSLLSTAFHEPRVSFHWWI